MKLPILPNIPGITPKTARHLKWKSLIYLIRNDRKKILPHYFFKKPLPYLWRYLRSLLKKKPYQRFNDLFLYGSSSLEEFEHLLKDPNNLLILGFSYCHKPHACPSKRFTPDCINDLTHPVCEQCFIGKALHAAKDARVIPLIIPTIYDIGEKIFEITHAHPDKKVLFLITACELTLEMFGDWGNMVNITGIGVRLDGRICNTMKAFELSERGIKPGLTVVLPDAQEQILHFLRIRKDVFAEKASAEPL